ncbi:MAG: 50S ribosomal protein L24 [Candidatus Micrarchaeota archaeon]|nr:50S ribosomal protein L24 [Candidatus Micrarchaeota archaeon]
MFLISSKQPRKQRKAFFNAPLHLRKKFLHIRLSKELIQKIGKKIRSMLVKKGDKVKVIKGKFKGKVGSVLEVDYKKIKVFVEGLTRKNSRGIEKLVPLAPSALRLIDKTLASKTEKPEEKK